MTELTSEQKNEYIKEYLYDEMCSIDFQDKEYLQNYLGTTDIKEIVRGIISYPLEHNNATDMYRHMDDKYFHILTDEQVEEWESVE